jgi:hypothetical protein
VNSAHASVDVDVPQAAPERGSAVLPITSTGVSISTRRSRRRIGEELSAEYCFAEPFPHTVLENFHPGAGGAQRACALPERGVALRSRLRHGLRRGSTSARSCPRSAMRPLASSFHFFNSRPMLEFLEG